MVKKPGVYQLNQGDRIYQAIEMAGGTKKQADLTGVNLAELLSDGQQIHVEKKTKAKKTDDVSVDTQGLTNINKADVIELTKLPGIGETKAAAIVKYREENGPFSSTSDIKKVSGIGDATYMNIESLITVK